MKIKFSENLRRLRKEKDITQEELSTFIGVSSQAISKWERGEGYPDITFLPSIASFFNVSIDELFGMNEIHYKEKRNEILQRARKNSSEGNIEGCVSALREGLHNFPNDFLIMSDLAVFLDRYGNTAEERQENHAQAIELYESILKFCKDNKIRCKSLSDMCLSLHRNDETDKAIKFSIDLPTMYNTEEAVLPEILSGKEKIEYCQETIQKLIWLFRKVVTCMVDSDEYSDIDKIELLKKIIAFYETAYEKEDYAFSHIRLANTYEDITILLLKQNKIDEALECLEKCSEHTIAFDSLPACLKHSSLLVNKLEYNKQNTSKSDSEVRCKILLDSINEDLKDERSLYHLCQQKEKFKQVLNKLQTLV
ncbi:MAG: helix-turn-helix transcriptional regulator [Ruminococcaceae bacterium]|nr:helix-turn-helix transcriptional regulator [Oscillospiraceae bacterium]